MEFCRRPPRLADLAADCLTYQFRELFNCPAAMNEFGYAQVGKSVSSITAIAFPPYACCGPPETAWSPGFLLTCELFVDGRFRRHRRSPEGNVEYQWFPHVRGSHARKSASLQFTTRMFLPSKQRAVMQTIMVKNAGPVEPSLHTRLRHARRRNEKNHRVVREQPGRGRQQNHLRCARGCLVV